MIGLFRLQGANQGLKLSTQIGNPSFVREPAGIHLIWVKKAERAVAAPYADLELSSCSEIA